MQPLTTLHTSGARRAARWLGVLAGLLFGGLLWLSTEPGAPRADGVAATPAGPFAVPAADARNADALRVATPLAAAAAVSKRADAAASDDDVAALTNEQRRQLEAALADHPQPQVELRRIAQYMRFQAQLDAWRDADPARRQALARQLDSTLDERMGRREVSADEARQLKAALLEDLEPDASRRASALTRWQRDRSVATPPAADAREARYAQAQADALARWQALPAAARDPALLQPELQRLREQLFPAGAAAADTSAAVMPVR